MPPTLANGKICCIEMPTTDIARSAEFSNVSSAGTSANAAMATPPLSTQPEK
jgi:hypothetical protein